MKRVGKSRKAGTPAGFQHWLNSVFIGMCNIDYFLS